jgi:hypothetical protein
MPTEPGMWNRLAFWVAYGGFVVWLIWLVTRHD